MWIAIGIVSYAKHHRFPWLACLYTFPSILQLTIALSTSYEVSPAALIHRGFRYCNVVPWESITGVSLQSSYIRLDYGKSGSAFNPQGFLLAQVRHRDAFLADLRQHLPNSVFAADIPFEGRILPIS
ncbi:MAG TPA: hypothetical protein VF214_09205 [Edaphobacter sp.]